MPDNSPFISILVLNWNGERFLQRCLNAISAQTFRDFEVLVLDNASTDGSSEGIETAWPGFQIHRYEQNLGFAQGNNRGARFARGEWLVFLNNDAFPEPDWLLELVRAVRENPDFSFFSSRLLYADQPDLVQSSGDIYNISGYAWPRDNNIPSEQAHHTTEEVFSPSAAAAMYRREAFIEAGGFDEEFSSHHEDVDLGFRLRLLGHRCLYVHSAVVLHIGSASFGRESDRTVYQVQRNVVWSFMTNMPGWLWWKYLPAHLFANLVFLVYYTLRGQAGAVWKAKWDAARGLPGLHRKRMSIQHKRRVSLQEIDRLLDHHWWGPFTLGKRTRRIRLLLEGSPGASKSA